ncbi:MAG: RNA ligase (ATP), partial [Bacteroidia bacterium]|nr:RNA ligase (ATP) [Bacteroidia bacterium]
MRKLASIQKILRTEAIEGADSIEKATVLGWELVI